MPQLQNSEAVEDYEHYPNLQNTVVILLMLAKSHHDTVWPL